MRNGEKSQASFDRINELEARLREAEETIEAIRTGEVDALVISAPDGEQIYTLKTAEHPYRVLVEAMSEGAVTLSHDGTVLYCNTSFAALLKTPGEKVLGATLDRFVSSSDQPRYETLLQQCRQKSAKGEIALINQQGQEVPVHLSLSLLPLDDLQVISIVVTDLTEQKRQQELVASEKLLRSILEQAAEATIVCDEHGQIIQASRRAHELCACNPVFHSFDEVLPLHQGEEKTGAATTRLTFASLLASKELRNVEAALLRPDGKRFDLLLSAGLVLDLKGRMLGCVVTLIDITERKQAERALQFQALVVSQINDAVIAIDNQQRITYLNAAAERQYGLLPAKSLGHSLQEFYEYQWATPQDEATADQSLASTGVWRGENIHVRRDGLKLQVESVVSTLKDEAGNKTGKLAVIRDISSRKRMEAALREREAQLRAIFDGTYEFIGLLSPEGIVLDVNRSALEWVGRPREVMVGQPFWETPWWTHTPGATEQVRRAVARAAEGEFIRQEMTLCSPKGEVCTFDFSLHPICDETGKVVLLVPEGRDITDRIKVARELERRYHDGIKLTETNRALVGTFEFDQVTEVICRAARALTGADGATFVLREGQQVRYVAEEAIAPLWKGREFPIKCCVSGWSMLHAETVAIEDIYADERIPHQAYQLTFVKSLLMTPVGPGTPVAAIGIYWAQQHQASAYEIELLQSLASAANLALAGVRAYEQARQAWAEAEQANRLKDEFLATLSHELRNPLNSIVGYATLLLRSHEARQFPTIRRAAETIQRNAEAQAQLINDLLDLSRLQTGKLSVDRQPITLNPILGDAVESVRSQAAAKGLNLHVEVPSVPLPVNADPVRVQQIVWNLVNNAVKFTPGGGQVSVSLSYEGEAAKLVVEDTGQGIDPDFLPYVFEMFRQYDAGTTRSHGGLGIGLALVKQLVELHGGSVEAHSEGRERGARFIVRFPLHTAASPSQNGSASSSAGNKLANARILIVDDSADSLEMLRLLLTSEGSPVTTAMSGEEALRLAQSAEFDLIISDISMPEMDGYEFLQNLHAAQPGYASIPAIALTGFGREEDVEKARQAGFTTHLTKPLDFEELLRLARVTLRK